MVGSLDLTRSSDQVKTLTPLYMVKRGRQTMYKGVVRPCKKGFVLSKPLNLFIQYLVIFLRHAVTVKLKPHIPHTILNDLSPYFLVFVIQWQYLVFQYLV